MVKFLATLTFDVSVEIDEPKFDEAFMAEFRANFFPFHTVQDHVEHIAQLEARGLLEDFTEGYGPIKDFGIKAEILNWHVDDVTSSSAAKGNTDA